MTKTPLKRALEALIAVIFWIAVWEITALIIDLEFIFPRVGNTLKAFVQLLTEGRFWSSILLSLLRILYGFALGVAIGIASAFLCNASRIARAIISPALSVVKSTPVASAIMLVWFIIGSESVPIAIAMLMVAPIVCQNLLDGFASVDAELSEVCDVFRISYVKRLRILIIPTLIKFLLPALVTASALAWKSGVAAEIITYTEKSIGRMIIDAKSGFDGAQMFALTLAVIIISVVIEFLIKRTVKAVMK